MMDLLACTASLFRPKKNTMLKMSFYYHRILILGHPISSETFISTCICRLKCVLKSLDT